MNIYSSKPSQFSKYKSKSKQNAISKLYYIFENETLQLQNLIVQIYISRNTTMLWYTFLACRFTQMISCISYWRSKWDS